MSLTDDHPDPAPTPASELPIVDLRSDTVTRPTEAMRAAIAAAPVGDDAFGEDPTVIELEERIASLLQKEQAIFLPSGVMANQIALRLHTSPGDEVIAHARSHVVNNEAGAPAAIAGVTLRVLDSPDGSLYVDDVRDNARTGEDGRLPPTSLICFENTHNSCGGKVVPQQGILQVAAYARRRRIRLHLDGARLWNAGLASGRSVGELATPFDTVSVCLSKGLGAPVGSLLAGSAGDLARARRLRRMMGGTMRQAGLLAAAGLYALDNHVERLLEDHQRAGALAEARGAMPGGVVAEPQPHIGDVHIPRGHPLQVERTGGERGLIERLRGRGVLATGEDNRVRLVVHLDIDDDAIDATVDAFNDIFEPYR